MLPKIVVVNEFDEVLHTREFEEGTTFAEAAMSEWPDSFPSMTIFVMGPDMRLVSDEDAVTVPMLSGEVWTIALRPQDAITGTIAIFNAIWGSASFAGLGAGTWLQIAITSVSLIGSFLLTPKLPNLNEQYQWDDEASPQFFSGQSNQFKPGSRVPEVFGTVRVWPDLIAEPWVRYQGDSQTVDEVYIVSNGECVVTDPRLYDEDINDLPQSAITVYEYGSDWPMDFPIMKSNAFVGGTDLPAENEALASAVDVTVSSTLGFVADQDGFFDDFEATVGSKFAIEYEGLSAADNNAKLYTVTSVSGDGRTLTVSPLPSTDETITDGSFFFKGIVEGNHEEGLTSSWISPDGTTVLTDSTFTDPQFAGEIVNTDNTLTTWPATFGVVWLRTGDVQKTAFRDRYILTRDGSHPANIPTTFDYVRWATSSTGTGNGTADFTVPGTSTGMSFDVEFPEGLFQQKASGEPTTRQVQIEVQFKAIVGGNNGENAITEWETATFTYTDVTRNPRRFTTTINWVDYVPETGGAWGEYIVNFRRITAWEPDTNNLVTRDTCRLIGLRGRQLIDGPNAAVDMSDTPMPYTMVRLSLSTQNAALVQQQRSFNVLAQRALPNWTADTLPGTSRVPTNSLIEAMLYTLLGDPDADPALTIHTGHSYDTVDVAALKLIDEDLRAISPSAQEFNGIVDQTMSEEDQLLLIAGIGHISCSRRANYVNFARLKYGMIPRTLINARMKLEPEQRNLNFSLANQTDGVIVRFLDADNDYKEDYVSVPEDMGDAFLNPSEQSLLGVTNKDEATRQAQRLWDKGLYERDLLEVSTTPDGGLLSVGDVVAITDALAGEKPIEGEVVEATSPTLGSYRLGQPVPNGSYVARLRGIDGTLYAQVEHTVSGNNGLNGELNIPGWADADMPSDNTSQVGLLYSLTPIVTNDPDLFYVTEVSPSREGPVQISMAKYDDRAYEVDLEGLAYVKDEYVASDYVTP